MRRAGTKMKLMTLLFSITLIIATIGVATYAVVDNNYGGSTSSESFTRVTGDADVDVVITLTEVDKEDSSIPNGESSRAQEKFQADSAKKIKLPDKVFDPAKAYTLKFELSIPSSGIDDNGRYDYVEVEVQFFKGEFDKYYDIKEEAYTYVKDRKDGVLELGDIYCYQITLIPKAFDEITFENNVRFLYSVTIHVKRGVN